MKINHDARIKDALQHLCEDSGASEEYAQGVIVGVVSAIMAIQGKGFTDAIEVIKPFLPADYRREAIPLVWRKDFPEYMEFDVISLSCLPDGNGCWSVNDAHTTGVVLSIPMTLNEFGHMGISDEDVMKALKAGGWIKPRVRSTSIEIQGESAYSLYINDVRECMPLYELRRKTD